MDPSAEEPPSSPPAPPPVPPPAPPPPDPRALAAEAERAEVRRLIDAGASTPEDLRALAEKMKQQRLVEEQAWREKVKPELMASKRFQLSALRSEASEGRDEQRRFLVVIGLIVLVVTALLAVSSAPWLLIALLLLALLVYAWILGRRPTPEEAPVDDEADLAADGEAEGPAEP